MVTQERSPEELRLEIETHVAAWGAIGRSTEPADRDRAESAILGLYAAHHLEAPGILWVPSPAAGVLAWHVATRGRQPLRNPYQRGDRGDGANQPFNALAEPFGPEPRWMRRNAAKTEALLPESFHEPTTGNRWWHPAPTFARIAARIGPISHVHGALGAALLERHGAGRRGRSRASLVGEIPIARDPGLARVVVGERWDTLEALIGGMLLEQVALEAVARATRELLDPAMSVREALQAMHPGQFDRTIASMRLLPDVLGVPRLPSRSGTSADHVAAIARSAGPWWALERLAIVCERPLRLSLDERGMLHSAEGPAIAYPDGFALWADHGTMVPEWMVTDPARLDIAHIDAEENTEVRRVMIERFGAERLIREGGATLSHEDAAGKLWRRELPAGRFGEPVVMVEVVNSTAEPDGTRKTYFLRVPPHVRTATAAVAWTFDLPEWQYAPARQT